MNKTLRVSFILHDLQKSGGALVVLEYARRLRKLGHDVRVYYPAFPYAVYFRSASSWRRLLSRLAFAWRTLRNAGRRTETEESSGARCVPFIADAFVRDADFVIATAWPTAYDVAALRASKGKKLYFIQGYETWDGRVDQVEASYRLPLGLITIAPWLTEMLRDKAGRNVALELHNGVDLETFRPPAAKPADRVTLLMMHSVQPVKGTADGLEVLRRLHRAHPDLRVRTFGFDGFPDRESFIEHTQNPSREQLLRLYQDAHIFLSPSLAEGWGLPVTEAMACGCAVVATRVGSVQVLESGGNLWSADPGDRDTLFRHADALVRDPERLRETARKGYETILRQGWAKKAEEFGEFLHSLATGTRSMQE